LSLAEGGVEIEQLVGGGDQLLELEGDLAGVVHPEQIIEVPERSQWVLAVGPGIAPAVQVDFLEGKVVDAASELPHEAPVEVSVVFVLITVYEVKVAA
jgi:hypothetical protein